jgi:hypothetical protein
MLAFLVCAFLHAWQIIRTKTWYFTPLLVGVISTAPISMSPAHR